MCLMVGGFFFSFLFLISFSSSFENLLLDIIILFTLISIPCLFEKKQNRNGISGSHIFYLYIYHSTLLFI